jgi:hypothetical protein
VKRSRTVQWRPGSFLDNLAAAADAVGYNNLEIAWGLARVDWETIEDRERFLEALTAQPTRLIGQEGMNA